MLEWCLPKISAPKWHDQFCYIPSLAGLFLEYTSRWTSCPLSATTYIFSLCSPHILSAISGSARSFICCLF